MSLSFVGAHLYYSSFAMCVKVFQRLFYPIRPSTDVLSDDSETAGSLSCRRFIAWGFRGSGSNPCRRALRDRARQNHASHARHATQDFRKECIQRRIHSGLAKYIRFPPNPFGYFRKNCCFCIVCCRIHSNLRRIHSLFGGASPNTLECKRSVFSGRIHSNLAVYIRISPDTFESRRTHSNGSRI